MADITQLHWENYKMRQAHAWRSLDRLVLAVVTLWAIPFVRVEQFEGKYIIFLFPLVALFLSYAGRKLLMAEYERSIAAFGKIKDENPSIDFRISKDGSENTKIIKGQIGGILKNICGGLILLSVLDFLFIIAKFSGIIKHW